MGNITTVKGSLFDAPKGSIIIHACNTKGVWGSGIAKAFAQHFPNAFCSYAKECSEHGSDLLGTCLLIPEDDYTIGCLFTSRGYGPHKDSPEKILLATEFAVSDLIKKNLEQKALHICKINSGLFAVPWHLSLGILKESRANFTVYDF
jgi:ADP-ribose 1''-phosphate phosphatase